MVHRNAPLSLEGRRRLVERRLARPIAHVAAEMGISRACASKWVNRYRQDGELGLLARSSAPHRRPTAISAEAVARIEDPRRTQKWSASRIAFELRDEGIEVSRRTVSRHLLALGPNRRKFIDPNGSSDREPRKIITRRPGHMAHIDVKKVGRIPDGGGWRVHGRGTDQAKAAERAKRKTKRGGCVSLHSAVDGYSRLAHAEALPDEKAATAIAFTHRARAWFVAHGITRIERIVTGNGACYRAEAFPRALLGSRHQRITPYTPRHNGKVERCNRIISEEFLYARTGTSEDQRREALGVWNIHHTYHRPHTSIGNQPPAARLRDGVTNVLTSCSQRSSRCRTEITAKSSCGSSGGASSSAPN
jgi:transposase